MSNYYDTVVAVKNGRYSLKILSSQMVRASLSFGSREDMCSFAADVAYAIAHAAPLDEKKEKEEKKSASSSVLVR